VLGSARIGDDVWIGPNATISNQVQIGDGAAVSLGSVVVRDVRSGQRVSGNFAVDHRRFLSAFRGMLR
jgi:UDP-3-O-[3-hydroxymyristoyl] glucosamine N-acyltransferase